MTALPWAEVVAIALIGTDRRPTGSTDPAAEVLDLAGAWTPYRRAGVLPSTVDVAVVPAPADPGPVVPDTAGQRLAALLDPVAAPLDGPTREAVLAEWLGLAVARGRRVPPGLLPALLDHGRGRTEGRALIAAAGGARMRWLAEQNPDWRYLTRLVNGSTVDVADDEDPVDDSAWESGGWAERLAFARRLRRSDPPALRDRLDREWSTLAPDERASLVDLLAVGLDRADEPLLERGLDDRRKEIREAAAALLVRLPGSAYQERMAGRAAAGLAVGPRGLTVTPPTECDRGMRRDGIVPKAPAGLGERAWWLEEVLARAPLARWGDPAALLARPVADDWASTVHRGLARAAAAQGDPDWAAAVLGVLGDSVRDRAIAVSLYPHLAPDRLAVEAITALTSGATARWGPLLAACPAPWAEPLARAALGGIAALARRPELAGELFQLSRLAAVRLPVDLTPAVRELVDRVRADRAQPQRAQPQRTQPQRTQPQRIPGLDGLATTMTYRHEMTREMS